MGDRFRLTQRQRVAVMRSACADAAMADRRLRQVCRKDLAGAHLRIDGYNALITVEAALAGGVILHARDGCYRDLASLHGTFRVVEETRPALSLLGGVLAGLPVVGCTWYLDRPVSNSGRLKVLILETAAELGLNWQLELVASPDRELAAGEGPIATADSVVLDRCGSWYNLARETVDSRRPEAWVVDLSKAADPADQA